MLRIGFQHGLRSSASFGILAAAMLAPLSAAQAAVTISSGATSNMTCSGGTCAPTASNAVLNVGDLETLLASGNVTVTTTGSGVQANSIDLRAALTWSSASTLALTAHKSIAIDQAVSIAGLSGLTLTAGSGAGALSFGTKGHVAFANLSSALAINGVAYTLVGDIATLASDITAGPKGDYALASNYDASADGTYKSAPITTAFSGIMNGLGNSIANLSIGDAGKAASSDGNENNKTPKYIEAGLFAATSGAVEYLGLVDMKIAPRNWEYVGGIAAENSGLLLGDYVSGTFNGTKRFGCAGGLAGDNAASGVATGSRSTARITDFDIIGGLVGCNEGAIGNSHAEGSVRFPVAYVGGLVGNNRGTIKDSFATGKVSNKGDGGSAGGLAGYNTGKISYSYSTGVVSGKGTSAALGGLVGANDGSIDNAFATGVVTVSSGSVGGLAGENYSSITNSYATGAVSGGSGSYVGGLVGQNVYIKKTHVTGTVVLSYSMGTVTGGTAGGFVGDDEAPGGSFTDTYWDTTTSGITNLSQGAGNIANDPGITGLTTTQFQSGLPAGFDPGIWAENSDINGGLPYLINNPPPKK